MAHLWYVRHDSVGGVIVEAPCRAAACEAVSFGGHAGRTICRPAKVTDRAWWHGTLKPGDYHGDPQSPEPIHLREAAIRRLLAIPDTVSVYALHPAIRNH